MKRRKAETPADLGARMATPADRIQNYIDLAEVDRPGEAKGFGSEADLRRLGRLANAERRRLRIADKFRQQQLEAAVAARYAAEEVAENAKDEMEKAKDEAQELGRRLMALQDATTQGQDERALVEVNRHLRDAVASLRAQREADTRLIAITRNRCTELESERNAARQEADKFREQLITSGKRAANPVYFVVDPVGLPHTDLSVGQRQAVRSLIDARIAALRKRVERLESTDGQDKPGCDASR